MATVLRRRTLQPCMARCVARAELGAATLSVGVMPGDGGDQDSCSTLIVG